ncbi:unnamed protein product [Auanema sp. JU1783]|nr:unnamed protein product [Auanema sp. JU1783]
MAGGFSIQTTKTSREPPQQLPSVSTYTILLTLQACIGGLLFGYDTGVVSSAMLFLPSNKGMNHLSTSWQELIVSITPGMAGIGALLAGPTSDRYGRRMIILLASSIFFFGALICAAAPERYTLLAGRILLGIAIGFASMIIPVFISEGSPSHIRGTLVTVYQFMIAFGFIVANASAALFALYKPYTVGWRLMFGLAAVPSALQFVGFLFLPDTPRYLVSKNRKEEAREVLAKVYNGNEEWINYEMSEMEIIRQEEEEHLQQTGDSSVLTRVLQTPHVRKALILGCSMQMFQQLLGINTILYYTGTIIQSAGVKDKITTIWISCAISAVQAVGTIAPMKLIEKLGRRPILLTSMAGVVITLCMMGGSFLLLNKMPVKFLVDGAELICVDDSKFEDIKETFKNDVTVDDNTNWECQNEMEVPARP